jgi:hypothetical protein
LGQLIIPRCIQAESLVKVAPQGQLTLVTCELEDDYIILNYHSTVTLAEHKAMRNNKPYELRAIDEIGRVLLPKKYRGILNISPNDVLRCELNSYGTVKISTITAY